MREFFDRMDSGAYDAELLVLALAVFAAASVWQWLANRRLRQAFMSAQERAYRIGRDKSSGRDSNAYLGAVMDALNRWEAWQRRPLPDFGDVGDYPSLEEQQALELLSAIPQGDPRQPVM